MHDGLLYPLVPHTRLHETNIGMGPTVVALSCYEPVVVTAGLKKIRKILLDLQV